MVTKLTPRQKDLLVRTTLGEAGGEDAVGQAAVMHVIMNRAMDGGYGKSLEDVMLAPKQFSTWNEGAGGNSIARGADPNSDAYKRTLGLVERLEAGGIPDMTQGATHYISDVGMKKLVDDGHQTNLMPKWWGEETSKRGGDGNGEWAYGGHRFTGRRKGWDVENKANPAPTGAPIDTIETTNLDTGKPIFEDVMRRHQRAALSENEALWGEGVSPDDYTNQDWYFGGGSGGYSGGGGSMSSGDLQTFDPRGGVLDQSKTEPEEPEPTTFMGKFKKWATPDRADMLLALGSGMLSSDGDIFEQLGEGGAALSKESARQQGRDMEQSQFETKTGIDLMKHRDTMELENARLKAKTAEGASAPKQKWQQYMFELDDGTTTVGYVDEYSRSITNAKGEDISGRVAKAVPQSYGTGDKQALNGQQLYKLGTGLTDTALKLTRMETYLDDLEKNPQGVEAAINKAAGAVRTLMSIPKTREQLLQATNAAEFYGVIAANRTAIIGGGAPSDKEAQTLWDAHGGNISQILTDPTVTREMVLRNYEQGLQQYTWDADFYDNQMGLNPNATYTPITRFNPRYGVRKERTLNGLQADPDVLGIIGN